MRARLKGAHLVGRLLLAVVSTVIAVLFLEVTPRAFSAGARLLPSPKPHDTVPDRYLGYRLRPSSRFRATLGAGGGCYDVVYSTDAFGRRVVGTPREARATRSRLVLFGCSYTLGEGLRDEETLQFKLGAQYDVINYAVHGHGPQHTLALLRGDRLQGELPEGDALALYVFYPFHFPRAVITSDTAWLVNGPYFELAEDGSLREFPSFSSRRPLRAAIYRLLHALKHNSILFSRLGLHWPPKPDPARVELTAAILIESARRFEQRSNGPFVVAVLGDTTEPEPVRSLLARLRAANVAVLDYSAIELLPADRLCLPFDGHPTGRFMTQLAERLEKDLASFTVSRQR